MDPTGWRLPTLYQLAAPPTWQAVEFISDLHLTEAGNETFRAWADYLESTPADAVFILGDLFEAWVGDDARASPFEAAAVDVLAQAASRRTMGFMAGNRDFLVGSAMLRDCGLTALQDPTLLIAFDRRVLLTHGDQLCLDDVEYQRFRALARSDAWRDAFLARPLAERRLLARQMRDASRQRQQAQSPGEWADVDAAAAVAWMHAAGSADLVHGHTHRPGRGELAPGFVRHVLSDWDFDGVPARGDVLRLTREGFSRHPVARR
jgi:UDP-2,3-diacylglucosamine hydrolase